jgi:hypothetical protein
VLRFYENLVNSKQRPGLLRKKIFVMHNVTSAAKTAGENKLLIAALKPCATQNRVRRRLFQQPARLLRGPARCAERH